MNKPEYFSFSLTTVLMFGLALVATVVIAAVDITHKPVKQAISGKRIPIEASLKDKTDGVELVRTYFKAGHESRYYFVPMKSKSKNGYEGMLPAPAFGTKSVEYLILAKNGANQIIKSQTFEIAIKDDEEMLARMQRKPPRDVRINLDEIEQSRDVLSNLGDTDPNRSKRVDVRSESQGRPDSIPGFDDYISLSIVSGAEVLGVGSATSTVTATTGGIGKAALAGGVVLAGAGGVALAGGGGGSGGGGGAGCATGLPAGVELVNFSTPNGAGSQVAPLILQLIDQGGTTTPLNVEYTGVACRLYNGVGTQDFSIPATGGTATLFLTQNTAGGSIEFHFSTSGGRAPAPGVGFPINGNAGDFITLQVLP